MSSHSWPEIVLNLAIALAYLLIPLGLLRIGCKSWGGIPPYFRWIGLEFILFILGCACTHLAHGLEPLTGCGMGDFSLVSHTFTAIVSLRTALRMPRIARQVADYIQQSQATARALVASEARLQAEMGELQARSLDLQRSNAELEQFAYTASHDLSQPVRSVKGFGDYLGAHLTSQGWKDEIVEDCLARIEGATDRMHRLLEALLVYSRIGRLASSIREVDLKEVCLSVLEDSYALVEERDAIVMVGELPIITADPAHMGQIFSNLITNAIKYTPLSKRPQIRVGAVERPECWNIYLSDRGEGIAKEHQEAIFQVCQRLHGAEIEGTGMGLAVVKKITEFYGGSVWVRSRVGEGSTFWVSLPKK